MPDYRLFTISGDNHIINRLEHSCADDLAALDIAHSLATRHAIEIWRGRLRVALVKAGNEPLNASDRCSL